MPEMIRVKLLNNGGYFESGLKFPIEVDGFIYDNRMISVYGKELLLAGFTHMDLRQNYLFEIGVHCEIVNAHLLRIRNKNV